MRRSLRVLGGVGIGMGVGVGAGLVYVLGPAAGRRRLRGASEAAAAAARTLGRGARAVVSAARRLLRAEAYGPDDLSVLMADLEHEGGAGGRDDRVRVFWQEPRGEAGWQTAQPPVEAFELEPLLRAAVAGDGGPVVVTLRRDGMRWRVKAERAVGRVGRGALTDTAESLRLTRSTVEALRRAGVAAEPGFPADPSATPLPVGDIQ